MYFRIVINLAEPVQTPPKPNAKAVLLDIIFQVKNVSNVQIPANNVLKKRINVPNVNKDYTYIKIPVFLVQKDATNVKTKPFANFVFHPTYYRIINVYMMGPVTILVYLV